MMMEKSLNKEASLEQRMSGVTHLKKLFVVWLELKLSFHVVGIGAPEALLDSIIDF